MTKARDLANSAAAFAAVSATELGYVDGVTSAIQTQMDAKAPSSTAVTLTGTQTLTNKTLTSPALTTPTISTATTNGDILYGTGSGAIARLGIGTTGQVLNVASGLPAWATASSGGMTVITTGTLSGTTLTLSSIPATYYNLQLSITGYNAGGSRLQLRVNADTGSNYYGFSARERNNTFGTSPYFQQTQMNGDGEVNPDAGATNTNIWTFPSYAATDGKKTITCNGYSLSTYLIPNFQQFAYIGTTAAISSITIFSSGASFSAGTYTLYGVK